jgi:hypothetical protein
VFVTQGPLDPCSPLFVGRTNEIALAEEWLTSVRCVGAVLGARQTGKTSFLFRLCETQRKKYAFAFVNLEAILGADVEKCFGYVAQEMIEQLEGLMQGSLALPTDDRAFLSFLSTVSKTTRTVRIAVLLDEVGALPPSSSIKLAHTLRAAFTNRLVKREFQRYVFLLAGSTDMLNLTTGRNSPLKNVTESIYLGDLSADEAEALLSEGFGGAPEHLSEEVKREIYAWTSGHPYWTQLLGTALRKQGPPLDGVRVQNAVEELLQKEDKNLPHLRRGLPDEREELWSIVARILEDTAVPFSRSDPAVAELELLGLVKEAGGRCVLRNRIYRAALEQWRGRAARTSLSGIETKVTFLQQNARIGSTTKVTLPDQLRILFLASNPDTTSRLDLEEELRALESELRAVRFRDKVRLTTGHAIRPDDLVRLLRSFQPTVVHFSGHGSEEGIILRSDVGHVAVTGSALARLLRDRGVRLVVLNACFSTSQAESIREVVGAVVGTTAAVGDEAARRFSVAFFRTLGDGHSLRDAFRDGGDAVAVHDLDDVYHALGNLDISLIGSGPD